MATKKTLNQEWYADAKRLLKKLRLKPTTERVVNIAAVLHKCHNNGFTMGSDWGEDRHWS